MDEAVRAKLGIDPSHKVVRVSGERSVRKGQDADIDVFEVFDAEGNLMRKVEVTDSTSIHPPFTRIITSRDVPDWSERIKP
ncbi:hypothetical protein [Eleftheria terrae]|uniref:hypothetical protein n=1 Tax=Eleftheria terrae TaxID=1597781 RepID=UPI00263A481B|nr:hypothetical protein [Eleftheria terrae]